MEHCGPNTRSKSAKRSTLKSDSSKQAETIAIPTNHIHILNRIEKDLEKIKASKTSKNTSISDQSLQEAIDPKNIMRETLFELKQLKYLPKRKRDDLSEKLHCMDDLSLMHEFEMEIARTQFENNIDELNQKYSMFRKTLRKIKKIRQC
ncbi:hypothetical protein BpHYR1_049578 [Brachionus plicatilis]|uniref:Uncharacterized protein n=1 Tax=Brachionus plicatilis TaxID=10195 RepID=A0A3M7SSW6_BRAPC|nr:hypothetical protein BpHYR1_049578 [Brachionus plicatilis]